MWEFGFFFFFGIFELYPFLIITILIVLFFFVNIFFAPKIFDKEKISSYECGFEPFEDSRIQFNIHYYFIAILFIIFDIEIILLFPFAYTFSLISLLSFPILLFFLGLITLGFILEWVQSVLKW